MTSEQKIWLVDDDQDVRHALGLTLRSVGHQVHLHQSGESLLAAVSPESRGCVVIDVRLEGMDGLALQQQLILRHIHMPRIFISGHGDIPLAVRAVNEGGQDFLEKPPNDQALLKAVSDALLSDAAWAANHATVIKTETLIDTLTPREYEVMTQMLKGQPSKVIAHSLGASVRTIEVHRARILEKLEVGGIAELISRVLATPSRGQRSQQRESANGH
jgi:FixJ family two-component response regulator